MAKKWSAFLAMPVPTVTHNDLEPYLRKGKPSIRKSEELKEAEDRIIARIIAAGVPDKPLDGALKLTVRWCFHVTGSHVQGEPHLVKPDTSNLLKTLEDCLTRCGVIRDDSLICQHDLGKGWSDPRGIYVRVECIGFDSGDGTPTIGTDR